jgi:hypothetical protein
VIANGVERVGERVKVERVRGKKKVKVKVRCDVLCVA